MCHLLNCGLLTATLLIPGVAAADDRPGDGHEPSFESFIAADVAHFGYREFDRDGRELNREHGMLPGLRLSMRARRGVWLARFDATLHGGTVDHDGETQGGRPLNTDTDSRHVSLGLEIGRWLGRDPGRWAGYVRLARRHWARNIQSTGNVQGLSEEYRWSEVGVGLRHVWPVVAHSRWNHELSVTAFEVVDGSIRVKLSRIAGRQWDDATLDLGREPGLRIRYSATRRLRDARVLRIEPYVSYWEFGRSESQAITSAGTPTGFTVTEPRSESRRVGIVIGIVF